MDPKNFHEGFIGNKPSNTYIHPDAIAGAKVREGKSLSGSSDPLTNLEINFAVGFTAVSWAFFGSLFLAQPQIFDQSFPDESCYWGGGILLSYATAYSDWTKNSKMVRILAPTATALGSIGAAAFTRLSHASEGVVPDFIGRHPLQSVAVVLSLGIALYPKTIAKHKIKFAAAAAAMTLAVGYVMYKVEEALTPLVITPICNRDGSVPPTPSPTQYEDPAAHRRPLVFTPYCVKTIPITPPQASGPIS